MKKSKKIKNTLVLLVWNEIEAIKKLYNQIPFDAVDETIVIDPGSVDGTIEFFRNKGHAVYLQEKIGRGNAFLEGLKHAKGDDLIFFSGDGNEDPKDIPKIVKYLNEGYDLVIAGRLIYKDSRSDDSDDPLYLRKFFDISLSLLVRLIWGGKVKDSINGFRGLKRNAMEKMNLDAQRYEIEFQTTIRTLKLGLKIKEFPTKELLRLGGYRKPLAKTPILAYNFFRFFIKELMKGKDFAK